MRAREERKTIQASAGIAANSFVGLAVRDRTLRPSQEDEYVEGDVVSSLNRGEMWVKVEAAVTVGDIVSANADTGQLSAKAAAAQVSIPGNVGYVPAQIRINGGRWMSAAAASGLARVRLDGSLELTTA